MAKQRINVGILISDKDLEIADFFNSLNSQGQKPARWVSALLVLNEQNKEPRLFPTSNANKKVPLENTHEVSNKLPASPHKLLFGVSSTMHVEGVQKKEWKYGWQKRGIHGEVVLGSVVNLAFCNQEIIGIIQSLKTNHIKIATYIKALIHQALQRQSESPYLTAKDVDSILRDYLIHSYAPQKNLTILSNNVSPAVIDTSEIIDFTENDPSTETAKNPLLSYIE